MQRRRHSQRFRSRTTLEFETQFWRSAEIHGHLGAKNSRLVRAGGSASANTASSIASMIRRAWSESRTSVTVATFTAIINMPRRNLFILLLVAALSWLCYSRASRNRYAATLTEAMNIVTTNYVSDVEPRVLFEGAMDGMVGKLDPYSGYTSPEEYNQFQQQLEGEFTGIGIVVDQDAERGRLNVAEALIGKPAYLAGIRAGDAIVAIDGKETKDMP